MSRSIVVGTIFKNPPEAVYKYLLGLEKKRRGVQSNKLIFLGMHNVAQYYWCGMYAVLKSRRNEWEMFGAFLHDRLKKLVQKSKISEGEYVNDVLGILDDVRMPKADHVIRWHFRWKDYVLVGVPDGMSKTSVFEEKDVNSYRFIRDNRPIAFTQADLYGKFFKKKNKIVRMFFREEAREKEWEERVDLLRANEVLMKFNKTELGQLVYPPKEYKCKNCEFKKRCAVYKQNMR